jgi:hypothetical protein
VKFTMKAILARFPGDTWAAEQYCRDIAARYPALRDEYRCLEIMIRLQAMPPLKAEHAYVS